MTSHIDRSTPQSVIASGAGTNSDGSFAGSRSADGPFRMPGGRPGCRRTRSLAQPYAIFAFFIALYPVQNALICGH
jgi:hypothetical protein